MKAQRKDLLQFCRYLVTGVINTLVTLIVIYICKSIIGVNPWVSNAVGYVAGLINSFVWNKLWVFHSSDSGWRGESVRFFGGFLLCYGVQLGVTWLMDTYVIDPEFMLHIGSFAFSGYAIATLVGMMVYTGANFIYNRLVTFRNCSM
ncbi:MAG: GtrA family protein [Candidatus Amulumruptor caecigallinarius]|nr:GtrA family protein [Candidatus Amulumruptor caecigallinarius]MCM1395994.1 GtrA family protein [Candidatus Amulumruptor caecigallinarius]MCM1454570.1 GtrA family protein [bacterium]